MQVLEDHHQRLIERLAQQNPFDRLQRPPLLDPPIRLRQRILTLDDTQQTEQIGQRLFQTSIKRE
jgi:hypothetical protein